MVDVKKIETEIMLASNRVNAREPEFRDGLYIIKRIDDENFMAVRLTDEDALMVIDDFPEKITLFYNGEEFFRAHVDFNDDEDDVEVISDDGEWSALASNFMNQKYRA